MRGTFEAELSEAEAEAFMRKVNGQGGFQSLLLSLQKNYDRKTRMVTLDGDQVEKINRYTEKYGTGGFENRLDGIRRNLPTLIK